MFSNDCVFSEFLMTLDIADCKFANTLNWNIYKTHCQQATTGNWQHRTVHTILAASELLPLVSQIVSLIEVLMNKLIYNLNDIFYDGPTEFRSIELICMKYSYPPGFHLYNYLLEEASTKLENTLNKLAQKKLQSSKILDITIRSKPITAIPPAVEYFTNVKRLDLKYNLITYLDFDLLPKSLKHLDLSNNRIRRIPDSIFNLPHDCDINLEHNQFTLEYITDFQRRLQEHPNAPKITISINDRNHTNPSHSSTIISYYSDALKNELATWKQEFSSLSYMTDPIQLDENVFLSLDNVIKSNLADYLNRLHKIKDYKINTTRPNVIQRVFNMLTLASLNSEFREQLIAIIIEGLSTCGDRVLIIFNDIEILWHMYQENTTTENIRKWAVKIQKYEELKTYAYQKAKDLRLIDPIETTLYFCIHLKDTLDLPITTDAMLYPGLSCVTPKMLEEAANIISAIPEERLLQKSAIWLNHIKKQNEEKVNEIEKRYLKILTIAEEYFQLDNEEDKIKFLQESDLLKKELKEIINQSPEKNYLIISKMINEKRQEAISLIKG